MMAYQLAQVNIAHLRASLDSPELADFVNSLDPINALADEAPGFIWRLQTEDGNATSVRPLSGSAARASMSSPICRSGTRSRHWHPSSTGAGIETSFGSVGAGSIRSGRPRSCSGGCQPATGPPSPRQKSGCCASGRLAQPHSPSPSGPHFLRPTVRTSHLSESGLTGRAQLDSPTPVRRAADKGGIGRRQG